MFGNILEGNHSPAKSGNTESVGCVDHLLNLTTKIAFDDTDFSEETMKTCRALVGYFRKSATGTNALIQTQIAMQEKPLHVIQDVTTRWWSTFMMCERLLKLKHHICFLYQEPGRMIDEKYHLNENQWTIIKDIVDLLQPFMMAQQLLEGEKFVTLSLIPHIIMIIRTNLVIASANPNYTQHARTVAKLMLEDFNARWGSGEENTIVLEHQQRGPGNRRKGIPLVTLVAFALDPRFKSMQYFGEIDKELLKKEVKRRLVLIANDDANRPTAAPAQVPQVHHEQRIHRIQQQQRDDLYASLFPHLNQNRLPTHNDNGLQNMLDMVDILYWTAENLPRSILVEDGYVITNPLTWCENNQGRFPLVATLARRILCITATSAPSERLFSDAGLTIAKDRARLLPDTASTLIFLQDAWELAETYIRENMA